MSANGTEGNFLSPQQGRALVELARQSIAEKFDQQVSRPETGDEVLLLHDPQLQQHNGTFVTLKLHGLLRGCIGNLTGTDSLIDGIRRNAQNAAFHDHRFAPLTQEELQHVHIEISILTTPQKLIYSGHQDLISKLRPGIDGVILRDGMASATFLPQVWEQLSRPEDFLSHLCKKAGLAPDVWEKEQLEVEIYQVQHFSE